MIAALIIFTVLDGFLIYALEQEFHKKLRNLENRAATSVQSLNATIAAPESHRSGTGRFMSTDLSRVKRLV